jgi:hypothetical protein
MSRYSSLKKAKRGVLKVAPSGVLLDHFSGVLKFCAIATNFRTPEKW